MKSDPDIISAILGMIQGLTEFLPVSSSGHLIFFSWLLKGKPIPLAVNASLHFGTLIAVLVYFWHDWFNIARGTYKKIVNREDSFESNFLLPALILGSVPAGVAGLLGKDLIEEVFHKPLSIVIPLLSVGYILWILDYKSPSGKSLKNMNIKDALLIGFAQAIALIPGVSRSGATISCARALGYERMAAARFSFLLGTPAMGGAALLHWKDFLASMGSSEFYIGIISSFLVGCCTIKFFLEFIKKFGFLVFALYRTALALLILVVYLA